MTGAMMKLNGYKEIASYIEKTVGKGMSDSWVRAMASRPRDPLPVRLFGRTAVADSTPLDAWIDRQWKVKAPWKARRRAS